MTFNFIINPASGRYSYQEVVDYIRLYYQQNPDFNYELHLTERIGHATEIAASIHGEDQCIVAIGGDGTLNEVLNGMNLEVTLACVPIGSGNDFVKMLNYPENLSTQEWMLETIEGKQIEVDFGLVNQHRFLNSCCMGIDAEVLVEFEKMRKLPLSKTITYYLATAKTVIKPLKQTLKIKTDDHPPFVTDSLLCTIMNGKYYGNGYKPTPDAQIQDNILNLCQVKPMGLLKIASLINKYKVGTHIDHPKVTMKEMKTITIESDTEILYGLDGELKSDKKLECRISETPLKLLVSKRADIN